MRRFIHFRLLPAMLILWWATNAAAGTITGTVKVQGLRSAANILVYLSKAPQPELDLSSARLVMDQSNLTFVPHVLPVPVGASVQFPNHDKVNHNVFSLSRTKPFNLGSYPPGESKTVTFDQPGVVELRCDVHAEMLAYILVLKSPYFAVTDSQGHFTIPDQKYLESLGIHGVPELPEGTYRVKSWHEKLKTGKVKVKVPGSGEVRVDLKLKRGTPGVLYK